MSDSDPVSLYTVVADVLTAAEIGYVHVIRPMPDIGESTDSRVTALTPAWFREQGFKGTVLSAGAHDAASGEATVQNGDADAVVYGRLFIANPDLVGRLERFIKGDVTVPFNAANPKTFYGGGAEGYTTGYPLLSAAM